MARITYGKTWWGKQWLNALNNIDYSNRLPRGKTYANKGAVKDFEIGRNSLIKAKVQGSEWLPYQQEIQAEQFNKKETELFLNALTKQPQLLSQLLNRQLPKELIELGLKEGIHLLPRTWDDLKMACSCPDFAVPCKHLAAVVYLIANEIDQNPFIIFQLRGIDIIAELQKRGVSLHNQQQEIVPTLDQFIQKNNTTQDFDINLYNQLDYSTIENRLHQYLQLLDAHQSFFNKDLKPILEKNYKKAAKTYQKLEIAQHQYYDYHQRIKAADELAIIVDEDNLLINIFTINDNKNTPLFAQDKAIASCIGVLETIPEGDLLQYPDYFIALHTVYRFAIKLLKEFNYLPRLLEGATGYFIQWIPAYNLDKSIQIIVDQLTQICPPDLLLLDHNGLPTFKAEEQIYNLCNLFIGYFMQQATEIVLDNNADNRIQHCFFSTEPTPFDKKTERQIPNSIQLWLGRFYMGNRRFRPVLQVEEIPKQYDTYFAVRILVEDSEQTDKEPIRLIKFLKEKKYLDYKFELLRELNILSQYYTDLATVLSKQLEQTRQYSGEEFASIFFDILPVIQLLNINVLLPRSLRELVRPKASLSLDKGSQETGQSFMSLGTMLEFEWQVALGDQLLSREEFLKLVKGKSGLVKIKDFYIHLDQEELNKLLLQLNKAPKFNAQEALQAALGGQYQGNKVSISAAVQELLKKLQTTKEIAPPKQLKATLRPYQQIGYSWMYKNAQLGIGSVIADDMGLGKTLQVITLLLKFKTEGYFNKKQALVIVPTSLLTNWMREIEKFSPSLSATTYHGNNRIYPVDKEIIITTYGVARSDQELLKKHKYNCLIIDEAQNIKNVTTAQTKAVKSIKADLHIAMSGTPVENRLSEYWSIMDFTNKGYLGSLNKFSNTYAKPIQQDNNQEQLEVFKKITAPFILRRLKSDKSIIQDLPDKIETDYFANLESEQAAIYQNVVENTMEQIQKAKELEENSDIHRRGLVLKLMGALKQICNHPYQYLGKGEQFMHLSGKSKLLIDLLDNIQQQKEKVLIFTQYQKMGRLMLQWITERYGREPLYLHGGTPRKKRDEFVDAFQSNKQDNIFILSLKAAGTGLNLTAANHVIHYDLWWNPAVEAQATDRAYRIGQKKNVQVYRFISKGTLEEKIDAMIQSKKQLANMTVATGDQWIGDLSDSQLSELVQLEK